MPASCGIMGCTARGKQSKFYSIPKVLKPDEVSYNIDSTRQKLSKKRNDLWLAAINRKDLLTNPDRLRAFLKNGRVCARHFYSGKPAGLLDEHSVDWVPRLHLGYGKSTAKIIREIKRELPAMREARQDKLDKALANCVPPVEPLAIYMPRGNENDDELVGDTCEAVYECGFCSKKFSKIAEINLHIKSMHSTSEETATAAPPSGKSARQLLIDLLQRLADFEWSDCGECETICRQFCESFEHHVAAAHYAVEHQPLLDSRQHAKKLAPLFTHTQRGAKLKCSVCRTNAQDYGALLDHFKEHIPEIERKPVELLQMFKPKLQAGELTPKKVLFKIRHDGDIKVFICTVCKARLEDRGEMLDHFKTHLAKKELPVDETTNDEPVSAAPPIQETVLDKNHQVLVNLTEYQCSVCADVEYTRTKILKCLRKHVQNGWPRLINAGLVWEALSKTTEDEVSELDVQADGPEVTVVTEPSYIEESLGKIALHCSQLSNVADVSFDERTFYYCPACHQYFDMCDEFRRHLSQLHGQYEDVTDQHVVAVRSLIKCLNCKTDDGEYLEFGDIKAAFLHRHQKHFFEFEKPSDQSVTRYVINPDETEVLATGKLKYFVKNCIAESFQCPCGTVYDFKSMALNCLAKHVGLRRYQCQMSTDSNMSGKCSVKFFTSHDLEKHIKKIHQQGGGDDNGGKVICHICGNSFRRGRMMAHMKNKHATEKKTCPICGKVLLNESRLTAHIRIVHKKEKPSRCKGCFKMWPDTAAARNCLATHKNMYTAAKPARKTKFECEFCTFTTMSAKMLAKHVEEHRTDGGDDHGEDVESDSSLVEFSS